MQSNDSPCENLTFEIPHRFAKVSYNAERIPGVKDQDDLIQGANCQVYAYEFLRHFGKNAPQLRSSELWSDSKYTKETKPFRFLDLMLYNKTPKAYGAHVGVYIDAGCVLHLSYEIGHPVIQTHKGLMLNEKYKCFIGAKRVLSS